MTGLNLRLKVEDRHFRDITGTRGASDLFKGLGSIHSLQSLAVSLHLSAGGDAKVVYDAMGVAFASMPSLELLWLEFQDMDLGANRTGLTHGLGKVATLKLMHAD